MSYRTIKRVLGETNLERKCRWWFGVSLFILLTLSFTWYGKRTDAIVQDLNPKFIGPELVRAGWLEIHLAHLADIARIPRDARTRAAPRIWNTNSTATWSRAERTLAASFNGTQSCRKRVSRERCRRSIVRMERWKRVGWPSGPRRTI